MKYRKSFIATLLVVFSVLVGIGVVEIGDRVYHRVFSPLYNWDRRIIFFDGRDSIFRNLDEIFIYVPNSNIFSRTIYFSESSYSTEFAYEFKTNNFGLIQDNGLCAETNQFSCLEILSQKATVPNHGFVESRRRLNN